jgi:hypothetical protein
MVFNVVVARPVGLEVLDLGDARCGKCLMEKILKVDWI